MPEPRAPEAPDLTRLVGAKLGNYRLERLIGRGRMGVVYLATDEALLRPTAVKVLAWSVAEAKGHDPVQWFLAEARLVARINDPRVVQVYGAARHGEYCYIAMEYVAGSSAEAMVARGERLPPQVATDILLQAASALHAAHRSGVVHRDVKPANLLVGPGGVTKLGDFGMALGSAGVGVGNATARVGTPFYTAPEVWRGGGASAASDIYSLGATYFHLLAGRPPFQGADVPAVEQAHLRAPVPDPRQLVPALPASCAALVRRALAKAPQDRHPSAQELMWDARHVLQDLVAIEGGSSPALPRRGRPADARRPEVPDHPAVPAAAGPLAEVLGFARRPFLDVDPGACPYQGEPHATVRQRILACADDDASTVIALAGAPGTGRSVLCQRVATELAPSRLVPFVDLRADREDRTLLQRLCRAAGAGEDGPDALEGLLRRLGEERRQRRPAPLVVLDGVQAPHPSTTGLPAIVAAAVWSRSFKLLLCGDPGLGAALSAAGVDLRDERPVELSLPALDRDQLEAYVRAWIRSALPPGAREPILTPDALLMLACRSQGVLGRIDVIAENMLLLAAAEGSRTVTSWHAWSASDRERWVGTRPLARLPRRAGPWPSVEALPVIDACRRDAGLPPWPRHGGG